MKKITTSLSEIPALVPLASTGPDDPAHDTRLHAALTYLHATLDNRSMRAEAMTLIRNGGVETPELQRLEDWRFNTLGKLAYLYNRGFQGKARTGLWMHTKIQDLLRMAAEAPEPEPVVKKATEAVADPADDLLADIVAIVESGGLADQPDRPFGLLTAAETKLATAKRVLAGLEKRCEAVDKKRKKDCASATQQVRNYIDNLSAQKKPRKAAGVAADKLVAGLEFMREHAVLQVVSITPEQIVGAKGLLVLNARTRKIGLYLPEKGKTLTVKGKSIIDFDPKKSIQKTLRKPEVQLPDIRNAVTAKAATDAIDAVEAIAIPLVGRINPDILLVKAFR